MIKELTDVEFPHAAIVSEYKIEVAKLPVPLQAKVKNCDKAIKALTDESTEEQITELLNESTLIAGLLIEEHVDKAEVAAAKEVVIEAKEEVAEVIEDIEEEQEEEEEVITDPPPPTAKGKVKQIVAICKDKGSITIDPLKAIGMKKFAECIVLDETNIIDKKGDGYVLREAEGTEAKEDKGDGIIGTLLAAVAGVGIVFGLSRLFGKK